MPSIHKTRNRILAQLPAREWKRLSPAMQRIELKARNQLQDRGEPLSAVYFPETGVLSMVTDLASGRTVEVATIGNEGMLGLPLFLGTETTPLRSFCQVPGLHLCMPAADFTREAARPGPFRDVLNRYVQAFFNQLAQAVGCNRVHATPQRAARWILQTHDRVGRDQFMLTQDFLAQMLGVRRASINAVAAELRQKKLINYSRGILTILSRRGMERFVCECYERIRREDERLLGPPIAAD